MRKKLVIFVAIIIVIIILISLIRQISEAVKKGERLEKSAADLFKLQEENKELKKKLSETEDTSFLEEQARNKLNMARSSETVVIIPDEEIKRVLEAGKPKKKINLPNYQGWLRLFIH